MFKRHTSLMIAAALAAILLLPVIPSMTRAADIHLEPNLININATYNGTEATVSGDIPADSEAVIQLTGESQDTHLLKKGRVFGVLWMNTGALTFENAPRTYMVYLPEAITESDLAQEPLRQNLGAGFASLKNKIALSPATEDKNFQFQEFIKLKTKEGLYRTSEKAVSYKDAGNGVKTMTCTLVIPSSMPQGTFTVTTSILKDKQVMEIFTQQLKIKETGLPAMISALAFDHSVIYGILATLLALGAGFLTGTIFKGGKGGH